MYLHYVYILHYMYIYLYIYTYVLICISIQLMEKYCLKKSTKLQFQHFVLSAYCDCIFGIYTV